MHFIQTIKTTKLLNKNLYIEYFIIFNRMKLLAESITGHWNKLHLLMQVNFNTFTSINDQKRKNNCLTQRTAIKYKTLFLGFEKKQPGEKCRLNSDCANNYCMPVEVDGLMMKECV